MLTPRPQTDTSRPHRPDLAFLLAPDERPRKAYPWEQYTSCPHCGSRGEWGQNDETGHCLKCSTWIYREGRAPWSRYNSKTLCRKYKTNRTVICCEPGCGAEFRTTSLHKSVRCIKCRDKIRKQNNSRYRKEAREKLKLAASSDERAAGCVLSVATVVKSQQKEATT